MRAPTVVAVIFVVLGIAGVYFVQARIDAQARPCEARGGVLVKGSSGFVCVEPKR